MAEVGGTTNSRPDPPGRGWYPVPGRQDYQRFWNGQRWGDQRYWGHVGAPASSPAPDAPGGVATPPPGRRRPRGIAAAPGAEVQYRGFFGAPIGPRSPARQIFVAVVGLILLAVLVSRHVFALGFFALPLAVGLVLTVVFLPRNMRFLRDPARQDAIREPVMYQSKVWLRFAYAPTRVPYTGNGLGSWVLAVRTDSLQVTNWLWGNKDRAQSTYFRAGECVMWRAGVQGRDCIVVAGPTCRRSKVQFAFTTSGDDSQAWQALARAGVVPVVPRDGAAASETSGIAGAPIPPDVPAAPAAPAPPGRLFARIGADLGAAPARADSPRPGRSQHEPPDQGSAAVPATPGPLETFNPVNPISPGGVTRRPPIPANNLSAAVIVVAAFVVVLVGPVLMMLVLRATQGSLPRAAASAVVTTTGCTHEPAGSGAGSVEWTGTVTRTAPIEQAGQVQVLVQASLAGGETVGHAVGTLRVTPGTSPAVALGPLTIPLATGATPAGTPTSAVNCDPVLLSPSGTG